MATEASTTRPSPSSHNRGGVAGPALLAGSTSSPQAGTAQAGKTDILGSSGNARSLSHPTPGNICGYAIDTPLSKGDEVPADSFLAIGPGGRGVVLKEMEEDCLLKALKNSKGGLHPSIRERLNRVRELALVGVANLHGIERDAGRAWLIWEYVPGQAFDEFATAPGRTSRELAIAARELVLTVELLHTRGIVHGAIKPGNVIVTPAASIRLTHVSPYLYTDPDEDTRAVIAMLEEALLARREGRSPLAKVILAAQAPGASRDGSLSLRRLGAGLAAFLTLHDDSDPGARPGHRGHSNPRRRSLAGAAVVTLLGAAAAYGVWHVAGRPPLQLPKAVQVNVGE